MTISKTITALSRGLSESVFHQPRSRAARIKEKDVLMKHAAVKLLDAETIIRALLADDRTFGAQEKAVAWLTESDK